MKKFLVGVGNLFAYDNNENLLFQSKTMSTSGIDISTSNTEIRGGQGHQLQYVYYYGGALTLTLTDTQFNLAMIAANVGSSITTDNDIWYEETITLGSGGNGTVTYTPLVTPDGSSTIYGWVTYASGATEKVSFSTKDFTTSLGSENDIVCVRYYRNDAAARQIQINSNFIPSIARVVVDTQLASSTTDISGATIVGSVQVEIPSAQFTGAQAIDMSSDGVSTTPLEIMALAYQSSASGACSASSYYATITEIINNANWYDNIVRLAVSDADIDLLTTDDPYTIVVWAIPETGSAFIVPTVADLSFTSEDAAVATVALHTGIVTVVGAGTTGISIYVTDKASVTGSAIVTVTAP
jgi:hypothetical protein